MKNPDERPEVILIILKAVLDNPIQFANDFIDILDDVEARVVEQDGMIRRLMQQTDKDIATLNVLHGMVVEYGKTIDALDSHNADLDSALDSACDMIETLQKLSGPALLYGGTKSVN